VIDSARGQEWKKSKPPTTSVIGGPISSDAGSRPRVPLHFELCTVCRFSQCCFIASIAGHSSLLAFVTFALNGRQGPHPPFHSPH